MISSKVSIFTLQKILDTWVASCAEISIDVSVFSANIDVSMIAISLSGSVSAISYLYTEFVTLDTATLYSL